MNTLFLLIVLSGGSVLGAVYFKKRFEETFVITLSSIMVFLYVFYIFNALLVGFYIALALLLACYVFSAFKVIKDKSIKPFIESFFTPGLFIFMFLVCLYYLVTCKSDVLLWDELRLWAAVPKALFYDPTLQLGESSIVYDIMQAYYPGMHLLTFFCTKVFNREFTEAILFFTYAVFAGASILPCTKHLKFKQPLNMVIIAIIIFLVPLTFYNSIFDSAKFYTSLYIDPILGIAFAYSLFLIWNKQKFKLFDYFAFTLSLATLVLLKNSGLLFAVFSFVIFLFKERKELKILEFFKLKSVKLKEFFFAITKHFAPMAITSFIYISWDILVTRYNPKALLYSNIYNSTLPLSAEQLDVIKTFFTKTLFTDTLVIGNFYFSMGNRYYTNFFTSWFAFFVAFTVISCIIYHATKENIRKNTKIIMLGIILSSFAYMISMCYLFIKVPNTIASYQRYINTSMLSWLTLLIMIIIYLLSRYKEKIKEKYMQISVSVLLIMSVMLLPLINLPRMPDDLKKDVEIGYENENIIINSIKEEKRVKVCLVQNTENILAHHSAYFNLIDNNIQLILYRFATETETPELFEELKNTFVNELRLSDIDYVYIEDYSEQFVNELSYLFKNGKEDIAAKTVYKVMVNENKVLLEKEI